MRFITVTELKQKATQVISEIESNKEEVVVTKNGNPVALQAIVNGARLESAWTIRSLCNARSVAARSVRFDVVINVSVKIR